VRLPAATPVTEAPAPNAPDASSAVRGQGAILIVDDERGVRDVARRALEQVGYTVLLAADRREALALVDAHREEIAAIVLDLTLGAESGERLIADLRSVASHVPVLVTSGYAAEPALRRLEAQGVAGFVQKPFTPAELANRVAEALRGTAG